jgi:ABC-type transporter Mla subunit MlaD
MSDADDNGQSPRADLPDHAELLVDAVGDVASGLDRIVDSLDNMGIKRIVDEVADQGKDLVNALDRVADALGEFGWGALADALEAQAEALITLAENVDDGFLRLAEAVARGADAGKTGA